MPGIPPTIAAVIAANTIAAPQFRSGSGYGNPPAAVIPTAGMTAWMIANTQPAVASTNLTRLDTLTGPGLIWIPCAGATSVLIGCLYDPSGAQTTTGPPVINAIGVDFNGVPIILASSVGDYDVSLPVNTNDIGKAANAFYTRPVEFDLQNSEWLLVAVKTAGTGTAFTDSDARIVAKFK